MSILSVTAAAVALPCAFALTRAGQIYKHSIVTKRGIEQCCYVTLGGIRQFIQIRGQDVHNPLVLFLHGGPGNPTSCLSYHYQKHLENDYTLVNWDQRGCGRTFYENRGHDDPITAEQLLRDLDELVDYLRLRFGKQKIILLGYSWGTVLGILYARLHPEKLSCYLSVCQCVHILSGSIYSAKQAEQRARLAGDTAAADRLAREISRFQVCDNCFSLNAFQSYGRLRNATCSYRKTQGCKPTSAYVRTGMLSPDCAMRDLRWKMHQILRSKQYFAHLSPLLYYLSMEFDLRSLAPDYQVPMYFLTADDDRICPADMIAEYFAHVSAPDKRLLRVPGHAHTLFFDHPEVFADGVRQLLSDIQ